MRSVLVQVCESRCWSTIAGVLTRSPLAVHKLPSQVTGVRYRVHSSERNTYAFDQNTIDHSFPILLGFETHGGREIDESFTVASRIDETDLDTWETEWKRMAERVERRAEECRTAAPTVRSAELSRPHRARRTSQWRALTRAAAPKVWSRQNRCRGDSRYRQVLLHVTSTSDPNIDSLHEGISTIV